MQIMAPPEGFRLKKRISPELFHLRRSENGNRFTAASVFAGNLRIIEKNTAAAKTGDTLLLKTVRQLLHRFTEFFIRTEVRRVRDMEWPRIDAVDGRGRGKTAIISPQNRQRCRNGQQRQNQFFQASLISLLRKLWALLGLQTAQKFHRRGSDAVFGFFSVGSEFVDDLRQQV